MPQYLVSVCFDDDYSDLDPSDPEYQRTDQQIGALNEEMAGAGVTLFVAGLHPASTATTLRPSGGEVSMTDGPFAETKEQMGGFWVIEAADLDVALGWARKCALACERPIELRPVQG